MNPSSPIAIFDSGLGGLTVMEALCRRLPSETVVYFGDSARNPYGSKSPELVLAWSRQIVDLLQEFSPKLIIVACNTASALALPTLQHDGNLSLLGVLEPGARLAAQSSRTRRIGVIGTQGTIDSEAYLQTLLQIAPDLAIYQKACPLFAPMVEEGRAADDPLVFAVVKGYLIDFLDKNIDVLVLGCTHYPILKPTFSAFLGSKIMIIDSAVATAIAAESWLQERELLCKTGAEGERRIMTTDSPQRFQKTAERFTPMPVSCVEFVDMARLYKNLDG